MFKLSKVEILRGMRTAGFAAIALLLALSGTAFAASDDVIVEDAWSRASIGTSRPGVAYMTIRNAGETPVTLIGLTSSIAMKAEVHRTATNEQGISSMEPAGDLTIAPGTILTLAPGGLHAMLMNLQAPINKGDRFKLTLQFAEGGEVTVEVVARGIAARGPRD